MKSIHGQTGPPPRIIKIIKVLHGLIGEHGYWVTDLKNIVNLFNFLFSISGLQDGQVLGFRKDQIEKILFHHGQSGFQGKIGFHQDPLADNQIGNFPVAVDMKYFDDFFHFFHGLLLSKQVASGPVHSGIKSVFKFSSIYVRLVACLISNLNATVKKYHGNILKLIGNKKCLDIVLPDKNV
jgi:hypothetical protein